MIMLKKYGIAAFLCFISFSSFGQGVKLGVFFDPTITWLKSDVSDVHRAKARMGFDFGLMVDYYFAPNYAFSTGLSLFNVGGTLRYDNGITLHTRDGNEEIPSGGTVKYKVQYIKLPIALKLKTHRIGRFVYYANLGFDPMVKVSAKANYGDEKNIGAGDEIKTFNIGFHIGGGVEYSLGQEASLMFGLTYMNLFADMTSPSHDKISANNLIFRIGVNF